jgi:uncharacterized protein YjbI with pentapeptide repeats
MMLYEIKNRFTGAVIFSCETDSMRACVIAAIKAGADLTRADLTDANLASANLARAYLAGAYLAGADLASTNLASARNVPAAALADLREQAALQSGPQS